MREREGEREMEERVGVREMERERGSEGEDGTGSWVKRGQNGGLACVQYGGVYEAYVEQMKVTCYR